MIDLTQERRDYIREWVTDNVWILNPTGQYERVIELFIDLEISHSPTYTTEIIGKRYIDYFNKWINEHEGIEERYIGKDDKLLDIFSFLNKRWYEREFAIAKKGRDFYLFGIKSKDELLASLTQFNTRMSHGRK